MASSARARPPTPTTARRRRGGRPTLEQAAQLDRDVRQSALGMFLEHGYEGTSMDAIAAAAGTTKASLYARFASKEALFSSVLEWAVQRSDWPLPEPDPPDLDDLEGALTAIANAALRRALHPAMIDLSRIAIAQAARFPNVARLTHSDAVWPRQQLVVEVLNRHAATGAIVVGDDVEILAEHFLGMVSAAPARLAGFGIVRDAAAQARRTEIAVQLFVRSLRPA
jgi:AcrR family transcriptional regulator